MGVWEFRGLGFGGLGVQAFKVLGFRVYGFKVLGFRGIGLGASKSPECGRGICIIQNSTKKKHMKNGPSSIAVYRNIDICTYV